MTQHSRVHGTHKGRRGEDAPEAGKRKGLFGITRAAWWLPVSIVALFAVISVALAPEGSARHHRDVIEFGEVAVFFEENDTDGDLGIQLFFDGEPWKRVRVYGPDQRKVFDVKNGGSLREIGSTEVFTESAEPGFDDLRHEDLIDLFPPGDYKFRGRGVEGEWLVGEATLTHNFPAAPDITSPMEDEEVDINDLLVVEWDTVADPNPPESVIEAYHVVVEKDEDDERLRVFAIDMLPTDTSVTVPPEFLEAGKDYKVENLAIETSGSKTITKLAFETAE